MSGGLILAAPASGSGKTVITLGLLRHLARSGYGIASAKAGPDYIDPSFHAAASGAPCLNLDPWAMRGITLQGLVAQLERRAEHVICEGVMGLFDGAGTAAAGSTADLAAMTGWPVVLIVDARGQGASAAALVRGFATHRPDITLAGVIFNRVSSERHGRILTDALAAALPALPMLGVVPRGEGLALPERHLGLVPAGEHGALDAFLDHAADHVASAIDVATLLALARRSSLPAPTERVQPLAPLGRHIAVARDAAFTFLYPAVLEGWMRGGAELSFFSPLADEALASTANAVYLPGGYPELHAGTLAGNSAFLAGLRAAATRQATIYGECGGYMALGEALIDGTGRSHRMTGLLPLVTSFAVRRLHLGYRVLRLAGAMPFGSAGTAFRGHEFHYARTLSEGPGEALFETSDADGRVLGPAGLRVGTVTGSFMHIVDRAA
ncbi:MAG TPA: cobyrinate a,c-diamide synthase [Stellaceae bacterium]|nr:cobyrinate a,c-diamide synthase [Stellaceae bacterium]